MSTTQAASPKIVSRDQWLAARRELLAKEKELTREYDAVCAQRRDLPWVKVEQNYLFDGPHGKVSLADLFDGRSQLVVRHFMFGPGWKEGCVGCSFGSDHAEAALIHLEHHDVTYVAVSRAPIAEIDAFRRRMGWHFNWVSSSANNFNFDYHVSFTKDDLARGRVFYNFEERDLPYPSEEVSGVSVFVKDEAGDIFHTYSCFARGDELGLTTYFYLDLTPKGRNENGPTFTLADWVRHHDRYEAGGHVSSAGRYVPAEIG